MEAVSLYTPRLRLHIGLVLLRSSGFNCVASVALEEWMERLSGNLAVRMGPSLRVEFPGEEGADLVADVAIPLGREEPSKWGSTRQWTPARCITAP